MATTGQPITTRSYTWPIACLGTAAFLIIILAVTYGQKNKQLVAAGNARPVSKVAGFYLTTSIGDDKSENEIVMIPGEYWNVHIPRESYFPLVLEVRNGIAHVYVREGSHDWVDLHTPSGGRYIVLNPVEDTAVYKVWPMSHSTKPIFVEVAYDYQPDWMDYWPHRPLTSQELGISPESLDDQPEDL